MAAAISDPEHKRRLEDMAQAWEMLAEARLRQLRRTATAE